MVPRLDIGQTTASDYSGQPEFSIPSKNLDRADSQEETIWSYPDWNNNWSFFNDVGDLKSALLMKSVWSVGKGWTADDRTTIVLNNITGSGKETFDDILFNADLVKNINGDSFTQIIRDDDNRLINLKPLDPGMMSSVWNSDGLIIRYEQRSKVKGKKPKTFQPHEILHLMNNRVADQIHGISDVDGLRKTILADQESFEDIQKLMHFQVKPFIIFKMKTDDQTTISNFVTKVENARKLSEDLFIPDDDNLLTYDVVEVKPSQMILDWRNDLKNKFYRQIGLPEINFGTSGATESGGKMEMFGHEQVWQHHQSYIEKQIWNQLGLKIDLISPNSLLDNLQTDERKDANQGLEIQPNDTQAGVGA